MTLMRSEESQPHRFYQHLAQLALLGGMALVTAMLAGKRSSGQQIMTLERGQMRSGRSEPRTIRRDVRCKGADVLMVYRKGARAVERLRPGTPVAAGDLVQIGYTAADATHGVIFSVDGRGVVTLHHPARVDGSTALEPFGRRLLPYAFELDGAPAFERFLFVTADRPIDVRAVLVAGRALAHRDEPRGTLPRGLRVSDELLLRKQAPR